MGTIYVQTTGATTNSGSTDQDAANLSGAAATVAGSVVTLDGSPDLSGLVTSGATQSSIYINDATNSNQKIFWITAFDNTAKTVTVSVAPTGVTSSTWKIGGRIVWTPANIEATIRAGDTVIINDDIASSAATLLTCRNSGDSTSGYAYVIGKSGTRPKLTCSGAVNVISANGNTHWWLENLEIIQQGASGVGLNISSGWTIYNCKVSDCGGDCFGNGSNGVIVASCEFSGIGGAVFNGFQGGAFYGNYVHDNTGDGFTLGVANSNLSIAFNIVDTNGGRGIRYSGGSSSYLHIVSLSNNTVYGNGDSGVEVTDADSRVFLYNNILQDNGNAAGEFNVEWVAGSAEISSFHGYNIFYLSSGTSNVSGLTINATETTGSPGLSNAAGANFTISTTGSAFQTGYPGLFLGGSTFTGYLSIGAVIPIATGGGTTTINGGGALIGAGRIVVS